MSGDDVLAGGAGKDTLDGGLGEDTADYSDQTADVSIALGGRTPWISVRIGNQVEDRLKNIEHLIGGSGNDSLTGNAKANRLQGGLGNDSLDGGTGADTLVGGAGNDTYTIDNAGDVIIESSGEGADTIRSGVTLIMTDHVENLILTGRSAINGTGNANQNIILGNSARNTLDGGLGDDTLDGGAGNDVLLGGNGDDQLIGGNGVDVLTGGDGADHFLFDKLLRRTNIDTITDFESGIDKILLDDAIFKKLISDSDFSDNFFIRSIVGPASAQDQNDFIVFDLESSKLYYDADGSGQRSVPVLFATLTGVSDLSHGDFWIV
jgi:Ca2+-binding RTX toxin-like protein